MIVEATAHYVDREQVGCHLIYPLRADLLASQSWCDWVRSDSALSLRFVTTTEPESEAALLKTRPVSHSYQRLSDTTEQEISDILANRSSMWLNFNSKWSLSPVCAPPYGDPVPLRLIGVGPANLNANNDLAWPHFASRIAHALQAADHLSSLNDQREELFAYTRLDGTPTDGFEEYDEHYRGLLRAFDKGVQPIIEDLRSLIGSQLPYWSMEEFYC
jgi:hypothetical protein